jgi:hypothetical protein
MTRLLTAEEAIAFWPSIEDEVAKYLLPDNDVKDIRRAVDAKIAKIIVGDDFGHIVFTVKNHVALFICIVGHNRANEINEQKILDILRGIGVQRIRGVCRPAAARLWTRFGMEPKYQIMERAIWVE